LFRGDFQGRGPRATPSGAFPLNPESALDLAALGLLVVVIFSAWIFPASRTAIAFTEAETAWLLPGPLTRPELIRFKLLKSQIALLIFALLMTVLTGRFARDGHAWIHALSWWLVFAMLQLHRLGASFALSRLLSRGLSDRWRRVGVLAIAATIVAALVAWRQSAPTAPRLRELLAGGRLFTYLGELAGSGPGPWLLAPFRLVVKPWFSRDAVVFAAAFLPALGLLAAHYYWVIRSHVAFEEESVQLSEKRAALIAARRAGDMRIVQGPRAAADPVYPLGPKGWAVSAFIWKSWIRLGGRRVFAIGTAIFTGLLAAAVFQHFTGLLPFLGDVLSITGIAIFFGLLFGGPQATAQSVRRELQAADWLKTAPVPGWQVMLGQMLGSALVWATIQWCALLLLAVTDSAETGLFDGSPEWISTVLAAAMITLIPFNVVASLVPVGVMLLFPGWFKPGEARGIEATGIGILMMLAQLLFLGVALVAPAIAFVGIFFAAKLVMTSWLAALAGTIGAAAVLSIEAGLGAWTLGLIFDRFDAQAER
jgi:hypothetical protein